MARAAVFQQRNSKSRGGIVKLREAPEVDTCDEIDDCAAALSWLLERRLTARGRLSLHKIILLD